MLIKLYRFDYIGVCRGSQIQSTIDFDLKDPALMRKTSQPNFILLAVKQATGSIVATHILQHYRKSQ